MKYRALFITAICLSLMGAGCKSDAATGDEQLIKASTPAVYYLGSDGRRYVFPTDRVYFSWYRDFNGVRTISDRELSRYPIGGNVTYRPGTRLVKITTDPKVYAVAHGGVLRWIETEETARVLFGDDWARQVDDVADTYFINYRTGDSVPHPENYSIEQERARSGSIDQDRDLVMSGSTPAPTPTPAPSPTPTPSSPVPTTGALKTIRVYVAGESIEQRNRYTEAPFTSSGALNNPSNNDNEQYGWSVPLADRLTLRQSNLRVDFVGSGIWTSADDYPYSGTYPSRTADQTSAISGTSIDSWLEQRRGELTSKRHCYDVAFAARGGNDYGNDNDEDYKNWLKDLIRALSNGSSCRANPIIYVTGHMPDDQRDSGSGTSDGAYVRTQTERFVNRTRAAVNEITREQPSLRVRFIDMYTPFVNNQATTAFPSPRWTRSAGVLDFDKIVREGDRYHPRRLSSIYAGEVAADQMNLTELMGL